MIDIHDRRVFLRAALAAGAAWATADLGAVEEALAWAAQQGRPPGDAASGSTATALTQSQAMVIDAVASRVLPAVDGRPGAREAGAVHFIDRALATFNAAQKQAYVDGIADLDRRAAAASPRASGFAALAPAQQDAILHDIEQTPFFQMVRVDIIVGTFALPSWGGNRDYAGWHLIDFEHQPRFQPPFGYYDRDAARRG